MKKNYSFTSFAPTDRTIAIIRQFAYTFRPIASDNKVLPFCLN